MVIQTTVNLQGTPRSAEVELNFDTNQWTMKNARMLMPGVVYSDQGIFEPKSWGVIWLMNELGGSKRTVAILHDAPASESDLRRNAGLGRLYDPVNPAFKDGTIRWSFLRRSSPVATPAVVPVKLSPVREAMIAVLNEYVPRESISSDDPEFKKLTGMDTKSLLDNFWEPENKKNPTWAELAQKNPGLKIPVKNTGFTVCNLTVGSLGLKLAGRLGKKVGFWLQRGPLQLDLIDKDKPGCWISKDKGTSPKVGDFYSIRHQLKSGQWQQFGHVGTIGEITADGNWIAVDGGQGGYETANKHDFIKRVPRGKLDPKSFNGWIDIDIYFS